MNRTLEKAATLSTARVTLGSVPATAEPNAPTSIVAAVAPVPCPHARNAELERDLEQREQHIATLEQELADLRQCESEQSAALAELQTGIADAHLAAEQRGYAEGSAAAEQALDTQWEQKARQWDDALVELRVQNEAALQQLHAACGELTLAALTKILGEQLSGAAPISAAIDHLIQESGLTAPLKIALAPSHYAELVRAGGLRSQHGPADAIELRPDAQVRYGGCLLETTAVTVDGRYEIQLQKLAALIRTGLARDEATP